MKCKTRETGRKLKEYSIQELEILKNEIKIRRYKTERGNHIRILNKDNEIIGRIGLNTYWILAKIYTFNCNEYIECKIL